MITCYLKYVIDPYQVDVFEEYFHSRGKMNDNHAVFSYTNQKQTR